MERIPLKKGLKLPDRSGEGLQPNPELDQEKTDKEKAADILYDALYENTKVEFFPSGATLLDLVLGGGWVKNRIINVVGDKSTGKCIVQGYLSTNQGLIDIKDIGRAVPFGESVYGLELGHQRNLVKATGFWKEETTHTIAIKTRHGYILEGSPDHQIEVFQSDGTFGMCSLAELSVGDYAAISKAPSGQADYISIKFEPTVTPWTKPIIVPSVLSDDIGYFLGMLVADGNIIQRGLKTSPWISLSNAQDWFEVELRRICLDCFGIDSIYQNADEGSVTYSISRTQLVELLQYLFNSSLDGFTGRTKYIPDCILRSPKSVQCRFLQALIDCDSWASIAQDSWNGIVYMTASARLSEQVQVLLLSLGIITGRTSYTVEGYGSHLYHDILIPAKYLKSPYLPLIGTKKYQALIPSIKGATKSDFDSIPYIRTRMVADVEAWRGLVGWSKNGKCTKITKRFPHFVFNPSDTVTYEYVTKFVSLFDGLHPAIDLSYYKELLARDAHFDPIASIEHHTEPKIIQDLFIPDTHLFWSNGFTSHNTLLAIEGAAGFKRHSPNGLVKYHEAESAFLESYAATIGLHPGQYELIKDIDLLEGMRDRIDEALVKAKNKYPILYEIDSWDALSCEAEFDRDIDKADIPGAKAREASKLFRMNVRKWASVGLTLFIVSQVRDTISRFGGGDKKSAGRALDFYISQELWLRELKKLNRTVKGHERTVAIEVLAKNKKNKVGPPYREAKLTIVFEYGIDDEKSNLDWLKVARITKIEGVELADLWEHVQTLRANRELEELRAVSKLIREKTIEVWNEIEAELKPPVRKEEML